MTDPLTPAELEKIGIKVWGLFAEPNEGADILLGNGFSISIANQFAYPSLFDRFLDGCNPRARSAFTNFGTTNFEEILSELASAERVALALGQDPTTIQKAVGYLRKGLIKVVEAVHPRKELLPWPTIERYAKVFDRFGDIYTTNYDALLYHMIMLRSDWWKARHESHPYNDYFWDKVDDEWLRHKDVQNYTYYKHVYYVHGALFLFHGGVDNLKIRSGEIELIEAIASKIADGRIPLFVSEGRSALKREAIGRNDYLRFAFNHLRAPRRRIVVFGFSFGEQDDHVVEALRATDLLYVSVYVGSRSAEDLKREIARLKSLLGKHRIRFYQAETLFP